MTSLVLVDVSNQRLGGGLQVARAVIGALASDDYRDRVSILAVRGSSLAHEARSLGLGVLEASGSPWSTLTRRIVLPRCARRNSVDAVYTVFGAPPWIRSHRPWIVGVAYSNLFYPEVEFWAAEPRRVRVWRSIKDSLRLRAVLRADAWIFETEAVRRRGIELFHLDPSRTAVVPPPVDPSLLDWRARVGGVVSRRPVPTILLAAGWHPNKNLLMAVDVARVLAEMGRPCRFVFTLGSGTEGARRIKLRASRLGVPHLVECIGRASPASMGELVASADLVLLISHLESFSNNVIEAFACGVPLVISDRDWARAACRDAAVYVEPNSAPAIADGILTALDRRAEYVERGALVLERHYPMSDDRMRSIWNFVEAARAR